MKRTRILMLCVAGTFSSVSAFALSYDQNVGLNGPAPSNGNDQGIYYGSGNGNGGWTVDINNNIELGLRAHVRYPSPQDVFNSSGDGVYSFTDSSALSPVGRGSWNYDFSINVNEDGLGTAVLSDYSFTLMIDSDPGAGQLWGSFDPLLIPDNGGNSAIAQNSENPGFAIVGIPGYDKTIAGSYDFILSAYDNAGKLVAQTYSRVNVNGGTATGPFAPSSVPDGGATLMLLGGALSILAFVRRKIAA